MSTQDALWKLVISKQHFYNFEFGLAAAYGCNNCESKRCLQLIDKFKLQLSHASNSHIQTFKKKVASIYKNQGILNCMVIALLRLQVQNNIVQLRQYILLLIETPNGKKI